MSTKTSSYELNGLTQATTEVIRLYETLGLTIEDITEETGYEVTAIKAILANHSRVFQDRIRTKKLPGVITDDELEEFTGVIKTVARESEMDHLRLKAAMYLRDDKLGRHDSIKEGGNLTVNVLTINAGLKKLKALKQAGLLKSQTPNPALLDNGCPVTSTELELVND